MANQPADVGCNCDIALICVKDYEAVSKVSFEKGGLIENPKEDLIVIQCSTIAPDESHKVADLYLNKGMKMVSVPILGGLVFVKGNNIDPNIFVKILNSSYFKTGISENKGPKIVNDDYTASFHLRNMVKDLNLALCTAHNSGLILPTTASAHAVYRASDVFGLSNMDYTSVASLLLKLNGHNTFRLGGE